MKLHVISASPNARKAIFVNQHSTCGADIVEVDYQNGALKTPDFLAMNPNGKIPTLEFEDGGALWESNAVINRLASDAKSDLWPASMVRYDIMKWQFWEASHFQPACAKFISKHLFGDNTIDIEAATTDFRKYADVLDGALAGRDWLVGDGMTTADVSVASYFCYRGPCHYPMDGYANIARWLEAIEALPAWKDANPAG